MMQRTYDKMRKISGAPSLGYISLLILLTLTSGCAMRSRSSINLARSPTDIQRYVLDFRSNINYQRKGRASGHAANTSGSNLMIITLEQEFNKLECGVTAGIVTAHDVILVDDSAAGRTYGPCTKPIILHKKQADKAAGLLWITTPVKSLQGDTLLILSSVRPKRTSVLAVDKKLRVRLLFDSFKVSAQHLDVTSIDSIGGMRVIESGTYLLFERYIPGMSQVWFSPRTFLLMTSGSPGAGMNHLDLIERH